MQATPASASAVTRDAPRSVVSILASVMARALPILTVVGLGAAAFYIEPTAEVLKVEVPAIEARDRYYGAAELPGHGLILVGSRGKIVRSADGGETWKVLDSGVAVDLQDIVVLSGNGAVAVGDDGTVVVTADGGLHWRRIETGSAFQGVKLLRLALSGDGVLWLVGERGMLARSSDRGATWRTVGTGEDATYNALAFADKDRGVVVGEFGTVLVTTDAGNAWRRVTAPRDVSLMSVALRETGEGVAVGLDGTVLTTSDAGASWRALPGARREHLFGVAWQGAEWIAVGEKGVVLRGDVETIRESHGPGDVGGGWRVGVLPTEAGVIAVGAEPGIIKGTSWTAFSAKARD